MSLARDPVNDVPEPLTNFELRQMFDEHQGFSPSLNLGLGSPGELAKTQAMRHALDAMPMAPVDKQVDNPKDAIGARKLSFSVLPWRVLIGVSLAFLEGAVKYGRHNYRAAGVRASVYFDAVVARHLTQWWEGEDVDVDSGVHHIDKAIAGLMVLRDSIIEENWIDDRPPRGIFSIANANATAARIIDQHADKSPRHYTIADS